MDEIDADPINPNYLTTCQYVGKDYVVAGGTDRSIVKIVDRHAKTVIASVKDMGAIYDIDVASKMGMGGNKFIVSNRNNIVTMDFNR